MKIRKNNISYNREEEYAIFLELFLSFLVKDMIESRFQSALIKELKSRFEGCIIMKNDSSYIQGIPDILMLYENKWAALECKKDAKAKHQPNQDYYVNKMNNMSYANFICPENKKEILDEIERLFKG